MCIYFLESYPWYHSVPKSFICCCSGRDSCMLTTRCMLPWPRSAPYPALCPCEHLHPVGDMQACPMALVPDSTVLCSRPPAPPTHHDIVKQYRKGPTAVVDRCVHMS